MQTPGVLEPIAMQSRCMYGMHRSLAYHDVLSTFAQSSTSRAMQQRQLVVPADNA